MTHHVHVAGAGAAGTALARGLLRNDPELWIVGEVACRTRDRAQQRCELLSGGDPLAFEEMASPDRAPAPGPALLLVSVPDRVIGEASAALARRPWPPGSLALHLSGAVEVDALAPLGAAGLALGGVHPLKSFVDAEREAGTFAGTVMAIEGDPEAQDVLHAIVRTLGGVALPLAPGTRGAWHAAATHACNHFVALVDQAIELMAGAGLDRDTARRALVPLLEGTLDNLRAHAPADALTGPVVRGDVLAVRRHVEALAAGAADTDAAYRALARRAVALAARERDLPPEVAIELEQLLRRSDPA